MSECQLNKLGGFFLSLVVVVVVAWGRTEHAKCYEKVFIYFRESYLPAVLGDSRKIHSIMHPPKHLCRLMHLPHYCYIPPTFDSVVVYFLRSDTLIY